MSIAGSAIAERIKKALQHAIKLCQQQLKEAPAPQKKELF